MGLKEKILDGFQDLSEKITADDVPLSGIDPKDLNDELTRRAEIKESTPFRAPVDNPLARAVLPGPKGLGTRKRAAHKRQERLSRKEASNTKKKKQAQTDILEELKRREKAERHHRPRPSYTKSRSSRPPRSSPRRVPLKLEEHYKTLGLKPGADSAQIKKAYRALMRKYHPDLHTSDPKKQKAANELSLKITHAYKALTEK